MGREGFLEEAPRRAWEGRVREPAWQKPTVDRGGTQRAPETIRDVSPDESEHMCAHMNTRPRTHARGNTCSLSEGYRLDHRRSFTGRGTTVGMRAGRAGDILLPPTPTPPPPQKFLKSWNTKNNQRTWIGLSDHHNEGSWKWLDNSPVQLR